MLSGLGGLFAIDGGGGADFRLPKGHRLALIIDIGVRCHHIFVLVQVLEHHHGLARQGGAVEGVGQLHRPFRTGGGELQLGSDLLLVHQQGFSSLLVHQDARKFVGLTHLQVLVGHSVHKGDFPGRFRRVFSVHRGRGADLRYTLELVIDGAQVDGGVIAGNRNVGNLHQLVPLISLAGQFL